MPTNRFGDHSSSGHLSRILDDKTPQLGGMLDGNGFTFNGAVAFEANAGEALSKGNAVYVSGVSGNKPVVMKADADDAAKMPAFGIAETDASLNANVNVVTFGTVYEIDTSAYSAGDELYVSTTAGELTSTKPTGSTAKLQNIGKVIRSHASAGSIKVGGAGRTNAVPNLDDGTVFIGDVNNQAEQRALVLADISDYTAPTETDPVYTASSWYTTTNNSSNWDTAYGWGNHASAGYLTSFTETDPVFTASAASGITSTNISNWNTAYGWGNHASAGYTSTTGPFYHYSSLGSAAPGTSQTARFGRSSAQYMTFHGTSAGNVLTSVSAASNPKPNMYFAISQDGGSTSGQVFTLNGSSGTIFHTGNFTDNSTNWNTAYGWGNHASVGYYVNSTGSNLSTNRITWANNETTAVTADGHMAFDLNDTSAPAFLGTYGSSHPSGWYFYSGGNLGRFWTDEHFSGSNVSNWQTAYGWGNHATQNYAVTTGDTFTGKLSITNANYDNHLELNRSSEQWRFSPSTDGSLDIRRVSGTGAETVDFYNNVTVNGSIKLDNATSATYDVFMAAYYDYDGWFRLTDGGGVVRFSVGRDNHAYVGGAGTAGNKLWDEGDFTSTSISNWNTAYGWGNHATAGYATSFDSLSSKTGGTGTYRTSGYIQSGTNGAGLVALTTNDGGGNANVTFNHAGNAPDHAGYNTGRITVNVDSTTGAYMGLSAGSGGAAPNSGLTIYENRVVASGRIDLTNSNVQIAQDSGYFEIQTPSGYTRIGAGSTSWTHFYTDRPAFYFGSGVQVDGYGLRGYDTSTDCRFPIYYDLNDTNYYCDPNSTSRLHKLMLTGTGSVNDAAVNGLQVSSAYLDLYCNTTGAGGLRLFDSQGTKSVTVYQDGVGGGGFLDNNSHWSFRVRTGTSATEIRCDNNSELLVYTSYVRAAGSFRAPLYYDFNNTSYFAHLDSTGDSIRAAGDIVAYYSDERLKDIEGNIPNALDKVCSLNGFYYRGNKKAQALGYDDSLKVGLSAQEVKEVLPEIIKDCPADARYMTVDYAKVVPLLVEAIKDLKAEIEELKK